MQEWGCCFQRKCKGRGFNQTKIYALAGDVGFLSIICSSHIKNVQCMKLMFNNLYYLLFQVNSKNKDPIKMQMLQDLAFSEWLRQLKTSQIKKKRRGNKKALKFFNINKRPFSSRWECDFILTYMINIRWKQ